MVLTSEPKQQPFLSIIIATLNNQRTIEKCLESIVQQTAISKVEILAKDGESTDDTVHILKTYDKYLSYWESSPDSGIYDAWNTVIEKSTGQWILFLGADDTLFNSSVVSTLYSKLDKLSTTVDIAYGNVRLVSCNEEKILDAGKSWEKSSKCIKEKMCIPHQGILHNRSLFKKHGNFSTAYSIASDYEFIRRVLDTAKVEYLNTLITCMQVGGISSDPKYTFKRLKEIREINKIYGSHIPGPRWLITYSNACFRRVLILLVGENNGNSILDFFRELSGSPPYWTKMK